ncbi:PP2C family protein-serine/threonine phosphatase [Streptomyces sp. BE20]|uniref:PP2C family protein-serine/threonine phosphatase n=1 Tax=Streptomyces sp. BE20 TaxID=3002525 RepID=UPI002E789BDF|nr:PP2C family protein-serine/threonine phosphatase [Streptomyces sp. BE20]MEE1825531.1 PP2C family protein-serine/threonine phosphatase [Streptomyces sp. BE20]
MDARPVRPRIPTDALLPYALIAVVTALDVLVGATILLALLAAPPALAAVGSAPRRVLLVGTTALLACLGAAAVNGIPTSERAFVAYGAVVAVTAAGACASGAHRRAEAHRRDAEEQRRLAERDLADAQAVADVAQNLILGPVPARNGSLDLAVSCTSAAAGARIGGDFYEAIPVPGGVRVIVGDVQGKGLPAVTGAVAVLQAFRESAPTTTNDLRTVADRIEERLARRTGGDEFVTAVIADCSHTGQVTLVNFGHPPPLVRRADGTTRLAEPDLPGLPLGLPFPDADGPGTCTVRLSHGDRILFYTDGTAEARNGDGDFFPLHERGALLDHDDLPEALTDLRRALVEYTGNRLDDDAAMLLLRFAPTAADAAAPPSRPRARMRPAAPSRTPRR